MGERVWLTTEELRCLASGSVPESVIGKCKTKLHPPGPIEGQTTIDDMIAVLEAREVGFG